MAIILNLETATRICSVGLASGGKVLALRESNEEKSHASRLTVFIEEILKEQGVNISDLDAIAVSKGPGSYTGLRIGVSTAKGIAFAAGIPLVSVNTLSALAAGAAILTEPGKTRNKDNSLLLCPMIDARRMEVYTALFTVSGNIIMEVSAKIIEADSFRDYLEEGTVVFFGDGSAKCKDIIQHPNAKFLDGFECSAAHMAGLAERAFQLKQFEDIAYFEPYYLKDFVATIPKNKGFG